MNQWLPVVMTVIDAEGWSDDGLQWVLANIAALRSYHSDDIATKIERLTSWKHRTTTGSPASKVSRAVQDFKALHRVAGAHALSLFLHSIETKVLCEVIPVEARRHLIREWVAKLQAFWSKDRCALLKSATTTSNEKWLWYRSLLGRVVIDGKWKDKEIDGTFTIHLPILYGFC